MQTTSNPNPAVSVRVLRVIWWQGEWRQPGDVIQVDYVTARGLESTHKGEIATRPETPGEVVLASDEPKKGKVK